MACWCYGTVSSILLLNTEPGFAGDIGAIEVWLIDWLKSLKNYWRKHSVCGEIHRFHHKQFIFFSKFNHEDELWIVPNWIIQNHQNQNSWWKEREDVLYTHCGWTMDKLMMKEWLDDIHCLWHQVISRSDEVEISWKYHLQFSLAFQLVKCSTHA